MNKAARMAIGTSIALLLAGSAQAETTLGAVRIGAQDVPTLAKFYESVFGLQEVSRLELPGLQEIMLNFGDSIDAAKKNPSIWIIIMNRDSDAINDKTPHLMLKVTDIAGTVAAIKAAGGSMEGEPRPFGPSGMLLGFAIDPAGNHVELIQEPKR